MVKRVVAVAGDRVAYREGKLFVDGEPQTLTPRADSQQVLSDATDNPNRKRLFEENLGGHQHFVEFDPVLEERGAPLNWPNGGADYLVSEGTVFASGDNRDNSSDSRYWGPVPLSDVYGKASRILWSAYRAPGRLLPIVRLARFGGELDDLHL